MEIKYWICPLCLEGKQEYGKNECEGIAICGNTPNSNAFQYLDENGYKKKLNKKSKSIGIAEIANKDE